MPACEPGPCHEAAREAHLHRDAIRTVWLGVVAVYLHRDAIRAVWLGVEQNMSQGRKIFRFLKFLTEAGKMRQALERLTSIGLCTALGAGGRRSRARVRATAWARVQGSEILRDAAMVTAWAQATAQWSDVVLG